ncbi:MAG: hypothetical protein K5986_11635 [Clostridium sp.]|nr:hypothetical protein [Clostridium sp.]
MMRKVKIGHGLMLIILVVSCLPLLLMSWMSVDYMKKGVKVNFEKDVKAIASIVAVMVDDKFESYINKLSTAVKSGDFQNISELQKQLNVLSSDEFHIVNVYKDSLR